MPSRNALENANSRHIIPGSENIKESYKIIFVAVFRKRHSHSYYAIKYSV